MPRDRSSAAEVLEAILARIGTGEVEVPPLVVARLEGAVVAMKSPETVRRRDRRTGTAADRANDEVYAEPEAVLAPRYGARREREASVALKLALLRALFDLGGAATSDEIRTRAGAAKAGIKSIALYLSDAMRKGLVTQQGSLRDKTGSRVVRWALTPSGTDLVRGAAGEHRPVGASNS